VTEATLERTTTVIQPTFSHEFTTAVTSIGRKKVSLKSLRFAATVSATIVVQLLVMVVIFHYRESLFQTGYLAYPGIALAEFGNSAMIAPRARLDDGLLDLVIVAPRGALRALWGARRLFNGTIDHDPGVQTTTVSRVTIEAQRPMCFHVDGEVVQGGTSLEARTHPAALRVRTPR